MASVTGPPRVTAAPISSSVKVARARPGTAAARRPVRVAGTGGTGTAVVDIGRSRRGGWRGRAPQYPPQPAAPTIARTAPAPPPRSRARARPCKLQDDRVKNWLRVEQSFKDLLPLEPIRSLTKTTGFAFDYAKFLRYCHNI